LESQLAEWDFSQPTLDVRSPDDFYNCHLKSSALIAWQTLPQRLNELPPRQTSLQLIVPSENCVDVQRFLQEKGYDVTRTLIWPKNEGLNLFLCQNQKNSKDFADILSEFPVLLEGAFERGRTFSPLWRPNALLQHFIEEVLPLEDTEDNRRMTALDIGCGGGREAVYLARKGFKVTAIEHKSQVLQRAQQLAQQYETDIRFKQCDATQNGCLPPLPQEMVMGFRFLDRALLARINQQIAPGGWLIWQTFVEGVQKFGSPKNPRFILQPGELAQLFPHYRILVDKIETIEDGRPVNSFIAQKPL
jgi:SAM-dependent methyltransferase